MLNKLKRFNRGIILAIIAAIGLTGFIAIDEITFRRNVPDIQECVQDYFAALSRMAVAPAGDINADGTDLTEAGHTATMNRYIDFINEFMFNPGNDLLTGQGVGNAWRHTFTKDQIISWYARDLSENRGFITNYDYTIRSINVSKQGPGLAAVDAGYSLSLDVKIPVEWFEEQAEIDSQKDFYRSLSAATEAHPDFPDTPADREWITVMLRVPLPTGVGWVDATLTRADLNNARDGYVTFRITHNNAEVTFDAQKRSGEWMFYGLGEINSWSRPNAILIKDERGINL
jgi:hypothetical protein